MSGKQLRVAVIGAGVSGIAALKSCKDEGIEPVCFERAGYISGLWHYTDEIEEGTACVMKSTVINGSKEMMSFSDFLVPQDFPIFMHNTYVDKYLNLYADNFGLRKHILFNTDVISVKPCTKKPGCWIIVTKERESRKTVTHTFDAVVVCTGHHADKNMPNFPGMDKFKGSITHTHDYKTFIGYEDKNVLVIGIGNSACDVAVELSRISKQVYISTRSGAWIFNRLGKDGTPFDISLLSRWEARKGRLFPQRTLDKWLKTVNEKCDHEKFGIKPDFGILEAHPTVSDDLPNRLASGTIAIKPNIERFTETGVVFTDGTSLQVDKVICGTGYIFGFPFIDKSVIDVKDNHVNLYMTMFPPDLEHHTMAIIGCFQPIGNLLPMVELQSRLAALVIKGERKLPPRELMWQAIRGLQKENKERYNRSPRHTIQIDFFPFVDDLAEMIGCKPNLLKLLLTDPKLFYAVYFGPATPFQFRLMGRGAWPGARDAIMRQYDRLFTPLKNGRKMTPSLKRSSEKGLFFFVLLGIAVLCAAYFLREMV